MASSLEDTSSSSSILKRQSSIIQFQFYQNIPEEEEEGIGELIYDRETNQVILLLLLLLHQKRGIN